MRMPDTSQLTSKVTLLLLFFQPMYLEAFCIIKSRRFILLGISSGFRELILPALQTFAVRLHAVGHLTYFRGAEATQTQRLLGIRRAVCNPPSATVIQLPSSILPWFKMKRPSCHRLFKVSLLYLLFFPPVLIFPSRCVH